MFTKLFQSKFINRIFYYPQKPKFWKSVEQYNYSGKHFYNTRVCRGFTLFFTLTQLILKRFPKLRCQHITN